ncbi:acyl--CoA ligase [Nitriliruptoraceae bacterium ZYF776]|nr:acyl--CoA ligase [Profundirhabdus halotolerans]
MPRPELRALAAGAGVHLGALTAVLADRYEDRVAYVDPEPVPGLDEGGARTFRDVESAVARLATVHAGNGVTSGQRVLVLTDNRLDVGLHVFALARLGAVPVPVNHRLTRGEIAGVAEATDAEAAVVDPEVVDRLPDGLACWQAAELGAAALDATPTPAPDGLDADATAVLLTTSGTTGVPKAASLTSRGLLSSLGRLVVAPVGGDLGRLRRDRDRLLACLPMTHVMGFAVLLGGLCAGIPQVRRSRFDADEVLDLIERERPNILVAVPTMFADLERAGAADRDLSSIQIFLSSADVLPTDRARRLQRYGAAARIGGRGVGSAIVVDIYGMVELSGAAAVRLYPPSLVGSLPAPSFAVSLPGIEVRAVDEDGEPVGRGVTGELQWRGAGVLQEYEGHEDAGPDEAGWFASGDHGRVLVGGLFQFSGRSKDRLKVGGFSVFPAEVEEELRDAEGVAELAIVGVPDDRLGDRLVAAVVPSGDGFDADGFLAWARDEVAGYRRPTEVVVVDHLPRGNNGKLDRGGATDLVAAELDGGASR